MICGTPPPTETVSVFPVNPWVSRLVGVNVWFAAPKPRSAASLAPLPVTETVAVSLFPVSTILPPLSVAVTAALPELMVLIRSPTVLVLVTV